MKNIDVIDANSVAQEVATIYQQFQHDYFLYGNLSGIRVDDKVGFNWHHYMCIVTINVKWRGPESLSHETHA
ncbi:hypothetical protein JHK84_039520 [Glycine max]|nr:hypothetical protein JHK84_039520 [Glycine max]